MTKLKVVVLGEKLQGEVWLKYLINSKLFDIVAGVGRKSFNNAWWGKDNFELILQDNNIKVVSIKDLENIDYDIIWSLMYGFKIPSNLIEKASYIGLNLHETPLPKYKGCNGITYAILNNDKEYGTTFQQLNANIDEGDIFDQEIFSIPSNSTSKELYIKTYMISNYLFRKNIKNVAMKKLCKIKENPKTQFNARGDVLSKKVLNFQEINNFETLFNYVRAFDFVPFEPSYFQFKNNSFYFFVDNSLDRLPHADLKKIDYEGIEQLKNILENYADSGLKIEYQNKRITILKKEYYETFYETFLNKNYLREIDLFSSSKKRCSSDRINLLNKQNVAATKDYLSFGHDYYDSKELNIGYGGYYYDGRYYDVAKRIIEFYGLKEGDKILEIGCAKGFLLVEFFKLGLDVYGIDKSEYATQNAHELIKDKIHNVSSLENFNDNFFDFVISKEVLPHLIKKDLTKMIYDINRISKKNIFLEIQVAKDMQERELMQKWDPTHKTLENKEYWTKLLIDNHYKGDVNFKNLF